MDNNQFDTNNNSFSNPNTTPPSQVIPATNIGRSSDLGKTLGIVGLVVTFFSGPIGLVLCIVALFKSKKAGFKNIPALIGIVVGIIQALVSLAIIGWFFVYVWQASSEEYKMKTADYSFIKETYTDDEVTFNYPATWTVKEATNKSVVGTAGVAYKVVDIRLKDAVSGQYTAFDDGTKKERYEKSELKNLIDQGLANYNGPSGKAAAASQHVTIGFGCAPEADDFEFISKPAYVEKDNSIGLMYSYDCTGYYGKTSGSYYLAYDTAGNRHVIGVNSLVSAEGDNASNITKLIESFSITD